MGPITKETRFERLIGRLVSPLPAPLARVVALPFLIAEAVAMFGAWLMPRRLPDLPRFTGSAEFAGIRSGVADWTQAQFALIEERAPWLHPVGRGTEDTCHLDVGLGFEVRLPALGVQCDRRVVAVYGADGPIGDRLADLEAILAAAGCEEFFPGGLGAGYGQRSPAWATWHDPRRARSDDEDATPPAGVTQNRSVQVGWASREHLSNLDVPLATRLSLGEPEPPPKANRLVRPVEIAYEDEADLAARAVAGHEHVIEIALQHCYYLNPDIRRYPLRRRLVPLPAISPLKFLVRR